MVAKGDFRPERWLNVLEGITATLTRCASALVFTFTPLGCCAARPRALHGVLQLRIYADTPGFIVLGLPLDATMAVLAAGLPHTRDRWRAA